MFASSSPYTSVVSVFLIFVILLQPGKGDAMAPSLAAACVEHGLRLAAGR